MSPVRSSRPSLVIKNKMTLELPAEKIMAKANRGLDGRHRDKGGKIEKKHGNTRIASLRKEYGASFA